VGIVAVVTFVVWTYLSGATSWAQYWIRLDGERNPTSLADIATQSRGTMPARAARFQEARVRLQHGLRGIYSTDQRTDAIQNLAQARQTFVELAAECTDSPLSVQEALLGAAQAEEALIGVHNKSDDQTQSRGSLDRVLEFYKKILAVKSEGYFADIAAKRTRELEENRHNVESFYEELNKRVEAKKK